MHAYPTLFQSISSRSYVNDAVRAIFYSCKTNNIIILTLHCRTILQKRKVKLPREFSYTGCYYIFKKIKLFKK